jgi:DNA-directed RNA polymerase subunit RPC12/RpoP
MNENLWLCFRSHIPLFRSPGVSYKLTGGKKVVVSSYQGMQYVGLQQIFTGRDGQPHTARININEPEWDALIEQLQQMDAKIAPVGVKKCPSCGSNKAVLRDPKHLQSRLSPTEVNEVRLENVEVQNQLGVRCEDCGHQVFEDCHCHMYNCRQCNDELFCTTCGENKFLYIR